MTINRPKDKDTKRVVMESEIFRGILYEILDGQLIVFGGVNGNLSVLLENVREFAEEIQEIARVYR